MEKVTEEILTLTKIYFETMEKFEELGRLKKKADDALKTAGRTLYQKMEEMGLQSFVHKEYGKIYLSGRPYCRVTDEEKAWAFLREQGLYDQITQLRIRTGRLNEFITSEYIEKGVPFPESTSGINVSITPVIRKNKPRLTAEALEQVDKWKIEGEAL